MTQNHVHLGSRVIVLAMPMVRSDYSPERDVVQDKGDNAEDGEEEPGEEGDAEVEGVADGLEDVGQHAQPHLHLQRDLLHRLHLLLQALLLFFLLEKSNTEWWVKPYQLISKNHIKDVLLYKLNKREII